MRTLNRYLWKIAIIISCAACSLLGQTREVCKGWKITGDPCSDKGAQWTYHETIDTVVYDLSGILFCPSGKGPFPGAVLIHGSGDNVFGAPTVWANAMRSWGMVCIATNYTFASGVPAGSPGVSHQKNERKMNILRAIQCRILLAALGSVDTNRIALHGFSSGAFLTDGVLGAYPAFFKAASHAGGGLSPAASKEQLRQANAITTPYQLHHGVIDTIIPYSFEQRLDSLLTSHGIPHQLCSYPGYGHMELMDDAAMLEHIKGWYTKYGVLK